MILPELSMFFSTLGQDLNFMSFALYTTKLI